VATTAATVPDVAMNESIHNSLPATDLLPGEHVVDRRGKRRYLDIQARPGYLRCMLMTRILP
jgi:hypothetical protein